MCFVLGARVGIREVDIMSARRTRTLTHTVQCRELKMHGSCLRAGKACRFAHGPEDVVCSGCFANGGGRDGDAGRVRIALTRGGGCRALQVGLPIVSIPSVPTR